MSPLLLESSAAAAIVYAVLLYSLMLLWAHHLLKLRPVARELSQPDYRWGTLDGLRGILATGVFVYHSFTAWVYYTTGLWVWSGSPVLNQLGQSTVAIFFMITGFLFARKALAPRMDWAQLYRARAARVAPLYLVVVCVVFAIVFAASGGRLLEPLPRIALEFLRWSAFAILGNPDINAFDDSWTVMAGVNWSLKYEVLFYAFGIPALYLLARRVSPATRLAAAAGALALLLAMRALRGDGMDPGLYLAHFAGGILVAYGVDFSGFAGAIRSGWFKAVAAGAAAYLLTQMNAFGAGAVLAATAIFAASVGGLSLFGLLHSRAALWLGDISYGIYLMHGIVLWLALRAFSAYATLDLSLPAYAALAGLLSFVIVALASLSYVLLERPAMKHARRHRTPSADTIAAA